MNALPLQQWAITFQWNDGGNVKNQQISKQHVTRHNGIIIIGRDPHVCDLVLDDLSISSEHAEIYLEPRQNIFFIRNRQVKNTTNVDGQDLVKDQELPLQKNSIITLGAKQIEIVVTDIQIYPFQSTNYSGIVNPSVAPSKINPNPNPISKSQVNSNTSNINNDSKSWQDKAIVGAIATIIVGLVTAGITYYTNQQTQDTEREKAAQTKETEKYKANLDIQKFNTTFSAEERKKYTDRLLAHRDKVRELRKEIQKQNGYTGELKLINECNYTVYVAGSFTALDDVLETRGWLVIPSKTSVAPGFNTEKSGINLYVEAKTNDNQKMIWKGDEKGYLERFVVRNQEFVYIEDYVFGPKEKIEKLVFPALKLDAYNKSNPITIKTFTCEGNSLKLE